MLEKRLDAWCLEIWKFAEGRTCLYRQHMHQSLVGVLTSGIVLPKFA
jgi:hypothetical protein